MLYRSVSARRQLRCSLRTQRGVPTALGDSSSCKAGPPLKGCSCLLGVGAINQKKSGGNYWRTTGWEGEQWTRGATRLEEPRRNQGYCCCCCCSVYSESLCPGVAVLVRSEPACLPVGRDPARVTGSSLCWFYGAKAYRATNRRAMTSRAMISLLLLGKDDTDAGLVRSCAQGHRQ